MCKRGVRLEEDLHHRALIKASETGQATGREMRLGKCVSVIMLHIE